MLSKSEILKVSSGMLMMKDKKTFDWMIQSTSERKENSGKKQTQYIQSVLRLQERLCGGLDSTKVAVLSRDLEPLTSYVS